MRVSLYARVSTDSQRDDLPPQVERLRAMAAARWPGARVREFVEIGSGATLRRPKLLELLDLVDRRRVDVVLIQHLDRITRSLLDGIRLVERIEHAGAGLVALEQSIDTTTPAGRAGVQLLLVFAEWQRADLRDRARKGIAAAKARGVHCGRRPSRALRSLDLEEVERRRSVGETWQAIADDVGVSRYALYRRVRDARRAAGRGPAVEGRAGDARDGPGDPPADP
ncbi:MAG: recombinase family protein [Planctomycetota bacterium JB042]